MRIQFPMTAEGRARTVEGADALLAVRVNTIIDKMDRAAGGLNLPMNGNAAAADDSLESVVTELPDGITLSYQRCFWCKDQFAVFLKGKRTEVVYRHSGNATVTYLTCS